MNTCEHAAGATFTGWLQLIIIFSLILWATIITSLKSIMEVLCTLWISSHTHLFLDGCKVRMAFIFLNI
jgi:hypothetical protein